MDKLFKESYQEKNKGEKKKSRLFIYLVAIKIKLNTIVMWFAILLNALLIIYMLNDFNIGVILFIINQYLVISYYLKVRRERIQNKEKKKEMIK